MLDGIQINQVAFKIPYFDFPIYWYGILIATGIGLGSWWASRAIEKRGQSSDELYNGLLLVILAGYVFARLGYVIQDGLSKPGAQYDTLLDVFNFRAGGYNILWGFVGAAVVGFFFARWRKLNPWHYADVTGPTLLIAQAIGRWGNFINQELYGPPTEQPWGILIDPLKRISPYNDLATYPADTRFHPAFLYESLTLFIGFLLFAYLNHRYQDEWKPGTLFGGFLIWWGANRAWVELFRLDQPTIGQTSITYSMLLSIGIALFGLVVILYRYEKLPQTERTRQRQKRVRKPKRQRTAD